MRLMTSVMLIASIGALAACQGGADLLDRHEVEAVALDNADAAWSFTDALDRVAQVCMEGKGFAVLPPLPEDVRYDAKSLLGSSVLTDPDVEADLRDWYRMWFGVGVMGSTTSGAGDVSVSYGLEVSEFARLPQEDQDAYYVALYGEGGHMEQVSIPGLGTAERAAGGCQREAEDALTKGNYVDYLAHAGRSGAKGSTGWAADARVTDARDAWSSCMAEAGYDYAEPMDVRLSIALQISDIDNRHDLANDPNALTAAEAELTTFVEPLGEADHACHRTTDLERVQSDVYWEYMVEHVSAHQEEFFSFRERVDESLAVAQAIIERGSL